MNVNVIVHAIVVCSV